MKFISRRVLAVVLAVVMLLGLLPVSGLLAGAATTELFENGGFESGSMSGHWQANTSATVVSEPTRSGNYAAKIEHGNGTMLQGYYNGLTSGKTYTLSYWVYVPTGNSVQLQLMAQSITTSGSGAVLPGYTGRYFVPISNNISAYDTWVQYTFEFTAGDTDAGFQFQLYTAQEGDLYYIDDVSLSTEVADKTYVDIDFATETDVITSVGYNTDASRTYLLVQTAQTLPIDTWDTYSGSTTLDIDGVSVAAKAAGMANANQFQIYVSDATVQTNFGTTASKITVPAGTEFSSGDTIVRFVSDFIIVKEGDAWVKYEEPVVVTPTDHGGDTELSADAISVGPVNGDFSATSDNNNYVGNSSKADGMAKIEVTGTDDYIQFNGVTVEAGKTYTLAFYAWIVGANDTFAFNVYMTSAGSPKGSWLDYVMNDTTYVTSVSPAGNITADTNGWQRVAITWTAPASGTATFGMKNYGADGEGTIYIDDVSVTTLPAEKTYVDIDFATDTDVVVSVGYNSSNIRTYLQMQTAQTLPIATWDSYDGSTTLDIDGVSLSGKATGFGNANQFQIYTPDGSGDYTGASKITIPEGTEFTSGDTVVRFVSDFIIVKEGSAWVKYEEEEEPAVVTPTDHTTSDYPEIPEDKTNLAAGGDFTSGIPSGMSATSGLVTAADGMAVVTGNSTLVTVTTNSVAAGHTYTYSMYYWATDLSGTPQFLVQAYYADDNGETGYKAKYSGGLSAGTNWTKLTFEYTIPETASNPYRLSFQIQSIEKASVTGTTGTLYVDDITLYDQNEVAKTYIDLAPNNGSVTLDEVGYNTDNERAYVILETAEALPQAGWGTYSGSAVINVDGMDVAVAFAGNNDANQFQIYVNDVTVKTDFSTTASTITVPAGTEFSSGDTVIRVTEAITLVNNYGVWMIDDPDAPEYQPIYAEGVSLFAAVDQDGRDTFGFEVNGVNIPYLSSWANFGYNTVLIDEVETSVAFGTTNTDATWAMDATENKFLIYTADGVYADAQEMIIPKGTVLVHPADTTLAYLFAEDVTIAKTADGIWPVKTLMGAQVALGDTLKSTVTVRIPSALYVGGMKLQYTVDGVSATAELTATGANQLYTAMLTTSAKNVTDTYTLQLITADNAKVGLSVDYSVADYAQAIVDSYLDNEGNYTPEEADAAVTLLCYASYAQEYFGYKTDDLAFSGGWGDEGNAFADAGLAEIADMTATATDETFVGCSLLLKDTTAIRLYFTQQHTGTTAAPNGLYYVDITGIGAANLDTAYTVEVNGVTYSVSVLSLAKKVVANESASDAFKMVARSLYMYWTAADGLIV